MLIILILILMVNSALSSILGMQEPFDKISINGVMQARLTTDNVETLDERPLPRILSVIVIMIIMEIE